MAAGALNDGHLSSYGRVLPSPCHGLRLELSIKVTDEVMCRSRSTVLTFMTGFSTMVTNEVMTGYSIKPLQRIPPLKFQIGIWPQLRSGVYVAGLALEGDLLMFEIALFGKSISQFYHCIMD
jgi:hypothetical protein